MLVLFFFFQAEDGIRDAQESRGLGDVYKRQAERERCDVEQHEILDFTSEDPGLDRSTASHRVRSVSYTHLTLPTIYSV